MNKKRVALILHGWPQPVEKESINYPYYTYFAARGYDVFAPNLFSDDFTLEFPSFKNYIRGLLGNRKPDVILGISFGGILAPQIIPDYPEAKLILIASGAKIKRGTTEFKILNFLGKHIILLRTLNLAKFLPKEIVFSFYKIVDPDKGSLSGRQIYEKQARKNIEYMLKISAKKEREIIKFITTADNTNVLRGLKNESLIFSGSNDLLLGSEGNEIHKLLVNSRLIITNGGHFEVFTDKNFADLDRFLNQ